MKSYIQSMFNSSFTTLGLEVREFIKDRFIKLEEKILSSQTQGGAPANTQTCGADPFWTAATAATAPAPTEAPPSVSARALLLLRLLPKLLLLLVDLLLLAVQLLLLLAVELLRLLTLVVLRMLQRQGLRQSLFSTLDVNAGTQEHLQKTIGNLTQ
ncbi:unnamed protein product [Brassica napus]|nr:unnamed protein product [Brassica napus]